VIFAGWLYYTQKTKQTKTKSGLTVNLKDDSSYPKIEKYQVPVLMYHYIRDASGEDALGKSLSVTPQSFEQQMRWLKDNDFVTISVSDLADIERVQLSKVNGDGYRPVVITFDDGYADAYNAAFPVLKKFGFTGTFFIISGDIGMPGYLNQDQINALRKAGNEIGSHTVTHPNLTNLSSSNVTEELVNSKDDTRVFCYPSGVYNDRVKDLVKDAGYVAAVTTKSGIATENTKLFDIPRVRIKNVSIEDFAKGIEDALESK
jgi:peptidoglycan/xylan/chitin deacetylase (PgdA/CDA1 family)